MFMRFSPLPVMLTVYIYCMITLLFTSNPPQATGSAGLVKDKANVDQKNQIVSEYERKLELGANNIKKVCTPIIYAYTRGINMYLQEVIRFSRQTENAGAISDEWINRQVSNLERIEPLSDMLCNEIENIIKKINSAIMPTKEFLKNSVYCRIMGGKIETTKDFAGKKDEARRIIEAQAESIQQMRFTTNETIRQLDILKNLYTRNVTEDREPDRRPLPSLGAMFLKAVVVLHSIDTVLKSSAQKKNDRENDEENDQTPVVFQGFVEVKNRGLRLIKICEKALDTLSPFLNYLTEKETSFIVL